MEIFKLQCIVCHRHNSVTGCDIRIPESKVFRENYVCKDCESEREINSIKIKLTCFRCEYIFYTKIFKSDIVNYPDDWICPICSTNEARSKQTQLNVRNSPIDCTWCKHSFGVCTHPDVKCSLPKGFVKFNNANLLYTPLNYCTILSICGVEPKVKNINTFKFTTLYKLNYLVSTRNVVMVRQRIGTRNSFKTNIILYYYSQKNLEFECVYNETFERGVIWFGIVRNFIIKKYPHLLNKVRGNGHYR